MTRRNIDDRNPNTEISKRAHCEETSRRLGPVGRGRAFHRDMRSFCTALPANQRNGKGEIENVNSAPNLYLSSLHTIVKL